MSASFFASMSEKSILSTRIVTKLKKIIHFHSRWSYKDLISHVYGSGTPGCNSDTWTCWWTIQTANKSMSSINRPKGFCGNYVMTPKHWNFLPKRTLPRNPTYFSRKLMSVLNGIIAEVKLSCILRGMSWSTDVGVNWTKCSRFWLSGL